jgi:AcrR family transcriptional regulator
MAPQVRKTTQRARLIDGMIDATIEDGYAEANVSAVIGRARVSRPTFYDYFADREACFIAALEAVEAELLALASAALGRASPSEALPIAVETLVRFAQDEPSAARFLTAEALSGGPSALKTRDRGVVRLARLVESAHRKAPDDAVLADIDPQVAIGSVYRMLAMRLRRDGKQLSALSSQLVGWVRSYERTKGSRRWTKLALGEKPALSPHVPSEPVQQMPGILPRGRVRISAQEVVDNHRLRILYAVARLAAEKGYGATVVADIKALARVDGQAFYRLFADKQEAFVAVHELGFQQVMDVTSRGFFSAAAWPERSWEAGRALTQLLDANPLVGTVGFVEAYAAGTKTVQRVEDTHAAFMFFMQDGLVHSTREPPPSREAMEATIAAVFEIVYLQARKPKPQTERMLGYIVHVWLAPFLGAMESDAFVDAQFRRERRKSKA